MPVVGESEASSLNLLVQGMRQLQQMYLEKGNAQGGDALKGSVELPQLPELIGETGVEFSDWLYVAEQNHWLAFRLGNDLVQHDPAVCQGSVPAAPGCDTA